MRDIMEVPLDLILDHDLLAEARRLGGLAKPEDTVHEALREYIPRREQLKILALFGIIDFDGNVHP